MLRRREATPVSRVRDQVLGSLESARQRVDEQFVNAEHEVDRIARRVDRRYRALRKQARVSRVQAVERVRATGREFGDRADAWQAAFDRRLQAHPLVLPAAAGALGFLAGVALGARAVCPDASAPARRPRT